MKCTNCERQDLIRVGDTGKTKSSFSAGTDYSLPESYARSEILYQCPGCKTVVID